MQKFQCLLFVLKQSYICHYIVCMTVPLKTSQKRYFFEMFLRCLKGATKKTSFLRCIWDTLKTSQKSYFSWDVSKRSLRCLSQWRFDWDLSETSHAGWVIPDLKFEFKRTFVFIWSIAEIDLLVTRVGLSVKVKDITNPYKMW